MRIRLATPADAAVLIEFNGAMALETEGKNLLPDVIGAGVRGLLDNPVAGFYVLAETERVIAALMITKEWSDWRNGSFWWIQSVYVRPEARRQGVYRRLYRPRPGNGRERPARMRLPSLRRAGEQRRAGDLRRSRHERNALSRLRRAEARHPLLPVEDVPADLGYAFALR